MPQLVQVMERALGCMKARHGVPMVQFWFHKSSCKAAAAVRVSHMDAYLPGA